MQNGVISRDYIVPRMRIILSEQHLAAVRSVLESGQVAVGAEHGRFAKNLARKAGRKYCVLTANGFSALFLSIKALGWEGINIGLPAAETCYAILNAIRCSGNTPVYLDNDLRTGNIDMDAILEKYNEGEISAVIAPSHFGILNDTARLDRAGVSYIEDNAQAAVSVVVGQSASRLMVLSFYPTKMINGIDGGAILTDDHRFYGKCLDSVYYDHQQNDDGVARYNLRLNNFNAALADVSLSQIGAFENTLRFACDAYDSVLNEQDGATPLGASGAPPHMRAKYVIRFETASYADYFDRLMKARGVEVSKELMLLPEEKQGLFINAEALVATTRSVPLRETLTHEEIEHVRMAMIATFSEIVANG